MRLTSLQLHAPELRLDDLSPGFNLVYAPQGEIRRLIPAALHCVLFGAPAIELQPEDDQSICELDILSPWGRFELQRMVSPDGDRLLARDSKGENRSKWLRQRMLADWTEGAFAAIFTPRFGDHAAFESLVRQALGESGAAQRRASLESLLREFEASRPWERQDQEAAKLREREARLLAELERLDDQPLTSIPMTVSIDHSKKVQLWQSRLRKTRKRLREVREQLQKVPNPAMVVDEEKAGAIQLRIRETSERMGRLEKVLADLRQRELELRARDGHSPGNRPIPSQVRTEVMVRYLQIVESLARVTKQLEGEVATLNAEPEVDSPWSLAADRLLPRLESLNAKLQKLCRKLEEQQVPVTSAEQSEELRQLIRCQQDLSSQLEILVQRREFLERQLESLDLGVQSEWDTTRIEKLEHRRMRWEKQERRCETELERLHAARRHAESHPRTSAQDEQREVIHQELVEVRESLAELSRRDKQESEVMLERMRALLTDRRIPVIFEEASQTLRQLTDGELLAVRPRTWGNDVVIEHAHGKAVTFDVLSRGERDQVQLSLSLATAADAAQRGSTFPLVLDDALRHMEPGRLRSAVELLRDHCRLHGQILLLTSQQNVATLCRSIGAASFYLDQTQGGIAAGTSLGRAAQFVGAVDEDQRLRTEADVIPGSLEPARRRPHEVAWDCEEFPGELRDRVSHEYLPFDHPDSGRRPSEFPHSVRSHWIAAGTGEQDLGWTPTAASSDSLPGRNGHNSAGPAPSVNGDRSQKCRVGSHGLEAEDLADDACPVESLRNTGYFLQLCDRMTEVPFTTRAISRAIESCGIYTVANFLHADPVRLAERLHELDVSASQLRRWQGQARLMCGVRKLRGYDAKILVACGVTSPEQLADIRPHELSEMVEAFVATPEGSRIVRSGSDFEISRITRWIRSVSRVASSTIPPARERSPSRRDESVPGDAETARERSEDHAPSTRDSRASRAQRSRQISGTPRDAGSSQETGPHGSSRNGRSQVEGGRGPAKSASTERRVPSKSSKVSSSSTTSSDPNLLPLKFYLEESSHVESAPSIGPQMAQRLEKIGIVTVANLLTYDPGDIAEELQHRRVSAEVVRQWQYQAELVCRIPQLRGHDAQILVACDVLTPEDLSSRQPEQLYSEIMPFVRSKAGQRILRQGKEPTLEEVRDWINWAHYARQLAAA
jgi:predicted flap endonuclease-1-like 5' DNA nuclease